MHFISYLIISTVHARNFCAVSSYLLHPKKYLENSHCDSESCLVLIASKSLSEKFSLGFKVMLSVNLKLRLRNKV